MERTTEQLTKDLLFNIVHQQEKVPSVLTSLLPRLYKDEKILKVIHRRLRAFRHTEDIKEFLNNKLKEENGNN